MTSIVAIEPTDDDGGDSGGLVWSTRLMAVTGLSYRRVDHWCRQGVLEPATAASGSGSRRQFHAAEVRVAAALSALAGFLDNLNGSRSRLTLDLYHRAAAAVRANPTGRWLVIGTDTAVCLEHSPTATELTAGALVVPLTPGNS